MITFSAWQKVKLFMASQCCLRKNSSNSMLKRLFKEGQAKCQKDMDIVKIIKAIKCMKYVLKKELIDDKLKLTMKHCKS